METGQRSSQGCASSRPELFKSPGAGVPPLPPIPPGESEQQAKDDRARRPTLEELRSSIIPKGEKRRRTTPDRYSPCSRPSDDDDDSWHDISLDGESESGAMDDDEVVVISDAGE